MKKHIFVLLILCFLLTGCWDRRELNDLSISLAIGIDKIEDYYQVSAQVVVPSEVSMKGSMGGTTTTPFTEKGETIYEAIRKMTKDSPRKIYPGHLRMLVIGEELAKEGIAESFGLLSRDWEIRSDFYVIVAKDITAREILNVTTDIESIPANKMFNSLQTSENAWAGTDGVALKELIANLVTEGKEPVLTGIQLIGNEEIGSSIENITKISPSARLRYANIAVFKRDKLIGWLSEDESIGYREITSPIKSTVTPISCPDGGKTTIEVMQFQSELKGNINQGKPEVNITIQAKGNVGEVDCKIDLTKPGVMEELEVIYENKLTENINKTIETVQKKYQADIFGFGEAIHRSNPKEWKKIKENWDEEFSNLKVNVKVEMELRFTGTTNNPFLNKIVE